MHLTSPKLLITEKSVPFQFTRLRQNFLIVEDRSREAHTAYLQIIFGMKFRQYHVEPALQKADMNTKN